MIVISELVIDGDFLTRVQENKDFIIENAVWRIRFILIRILIRLRIQLSGPDFFSYCFSIKIIFLQKIMQMKRIHKDPDPQH